MKYVSIRYGAVVAVVLLTVGPAGGCSNDGEIGTGEIDTAAAVAEHGMDTVGRNSAEDTAETRGAGDLDTLGEPRDSIDSRGN